MGKTTILVSCLDQQLAITDGPVIASGGRNEDDILFDFCPLWNGFGKVAVFHREGGEPYTVALTENRCTIPAEVLQTEGFFYFGVFGTKDDATRTSEVVKYKVVKGALTEGKEPADPAPDIYAQFLTRAGEMEAQYQEVKEDLNSLAAFEQQPFSATGDSVQVTAFEDAPLECTTTIVLNQLGSGDPSPTNIRPIKAYTSAQLTCSGANDDKVRTVDFGAPVFAGVLNWGAGILERNRLSLTFDGSEDWRQVSSGDTVYYYLVLGGLGYLTGANSTKYCSHLTPADVRSSTTDIGFNSGDSTSASESRVSLRPGVSGVTDVASWKAYLAAQAAAGTPVQVSVLLAKPETMQLKPQPVHAHRGVNTVTADVGKTTVSGRNDILWMTSHLLKRIEALEAAQN